MYLITGVIIIVGYVLGYRYFQGDTRSLLDEELSTRQLYHHMYGATRYRR